MSSEPMALGGSVLLHLCLSHVPTSTGGLKLAGPSDPSLQFLGSTNGRLTHSSARTTSFLLCPFPILSFPRHSPPHCSARMRRCSYGSCTRRPNFNAKGIKTAGYCKQHAEDGMVDVRSRSCSHDSCTRIPSFNIEGSKTAAYCKCHAEDGMLNVLDRRCSHDSCMRIPSFNIEGSKTAAYCKRHAEDGMLNVLDRRCSHDSCTRVPRWGVLTGGAATVCSRHKSDILGSPVIHFVAACKVAGCRKVSKWGLDGKQPSHCPDHGPLEDELVCTVAVGSARSKRFFS